MNETETTRRTIYYVSDMMTGKIWDGTKRRFVREDGTGYTSEARALRAARLAVVLVANLGDVVIKTCKR